MVKSYDCLTQAIVSAYGNRKKPGRVSVFTDVENNKIYPVPINEEHINFVKRIATPSYYEKIVPTHIDLERNEKGLEEVVRVITGECGLEIKGGVRHKYEDLKKAHALVFEFINKGEFPIGELKENKIVTRYAKK